MGKLACASSCMHQSSRCGTDHLAKASWGLMHQMTQAVKSQPPSQGQRKMEPKVNLQAEQVGLIPCLSLLPLSSYSLIKTTSSIVGDSEGDQDNGEASSQQGQVASAHAAGQGEQATASGSAGAVKANEAMGDEKVVQATHDVLKQTETSAAALMAAYCTFGDRALPFVPFSPLFDLYL